MNNQWKKILFHVRKSEKFDRFRKSFNKILFKVIKFKKQFNTRNKYWLTFIKYKTKFLLMNLNILDRDKKAKKLGFLNLKKSLIHIC